MRWLASAVLAAAGVALIGIAGWWRGWETALSGHAIHFLTGEITVAEPTRHLLILNKGTSVQSIFILTSECSAAYLLAALLIGSAPLMLLRGLSPWRTALAVGFAGTIMIFQNIARMAAIGLTVSRIGTDPGFAIAHTYLGSVLTIVGTCAAGVVFAIVLVGKRQASLPGRRLRLP